MTEMTPLAPPTPGVHILQNPTTADGVLACIRQFLPHELSALLFYSPLPRVSLSIKDLKPTNWWRRASGHKRYDIIDNALTTFTYLTGFAFSNKTPIVFVRIPLEPTGCRLA